MLSVSSMSEPRVIEDDGGDTIKDVLVEQSLRDEDKLERLEKNLQRAEELRNIELSNNLETERESNNADDEQPKNKRQKLLGKEDGKSDIMFAPSFEEVTKDKDHLATLRGEGRYFGVVDPDISQPVCSNCHRRGHRRAQCKVVVCHACGKVDDHYESQCPNSMVCSNCGEKGHFRNTCPSKRFQNYCVECNSRDHTTDRCPTIWRSYVLRRKDKNTKIAYPTNMIFCYNCAEKGHYGDDCPEFRVSKTPNINGSAFSGDNLPKELVAQYKNLQHKDTNNRKRSFATSNLNYNYAPPNYNNFSRYDTNSLATGPSKQGIFTKKNASQNQRRINSSYSNDNYGNRQKNYKSNNYRSAVYSGQQNNHNSNFGITRSTYLNNNQHNNYLNSNRKRY